MARFIHGYAVIMDHRRVIKKIFESKVEGRRKMGNLD
jgi:hypothetical protein